MEILTAEELGAELDGLDGWETDGTAIRREFEFAGFSEAIGFVNRVAELADAANHHPQLTNMYSRVSIVLTSHDAGGVTRKDLDLAARIDRVVDA